MQKIIYEVVEMYENCRYLLGLLWVWWGFSSGAVGFGKMMFSLALERFIAHTSPVAALRNIEMHLIILAARTILNFEFDIAST